MHNCLTFKPGPVASLIASEHDDPTVQLSRLLVERYTIVWQGRLVLKEFSALMQFHHVHGNIEVATASLPINGDHSTPPMKMTHLYSTGRDQMHDFAKQIRVR